MSQTPDKDKDQEEREEKIIRRLKESELDELELELVKERVKPSFLSRIKNAGIGVFGGFILGSAIYAIALTDPNAPGYFSAIPFIAGIAGALFGFGSRREL